MSEPVAFNARSTRLALILVLTLLVAAVYAQVGGHEFVSFDDHLYVSENPHVRNGLSADSVRWALSTSHQERTYWHPLTWLSHMLDCELFGLDAGRHHLVNVLLHLVNAILLLLVFERLTGAVWPSALVAFLFALHPLNVDSVAWLAQRKSVLSTLFCLLTMLVYIAWCRRPAASTYTAMAALFGLGLLAKPVLVSLPCILLLLDLWPLGRLRQLRWHASPHHSPPEPAPLAESVGLGRAILEKLPLAALALASVVVTMQWPAGENVSWAARGLGLRLANAVVSLVEYLALVVAPHDLAVFYPYPTSVPSWRWLAALVVVVAITAVAAAQWRRRPYLTVGWLWFVGSLGPALGVLQQGLWPARSDRWAYLPFIGIFIILAWGGAELVSRRRLGQRMAAAVASVAVAALALLSWHQTGHWRSSVDLFEHALAVTRDNHQVHVMLGVILLEEGRPEEAIAHLRAASEIHPDPTTHLNLGTALLSVGALDAAEGQFRAAVAIDDELAWAHNGLGVALSRQGQLDEAIDHFERALTLDDGLEAARENLDRALQLRRRRSEGVASAPSG